MKAQRGSGGIAFFNHSTRLGGGLLMVNSTFWPLYSWEWPSTHCTGRWVGLSWAERELKISPYPGFDTDQRIVFNSTQKIKLLLQLWTLHVAYPQEQYSHLVQTPQNHKTSLSGPWKIPVHDTLIQQQNYTSHRQNAVGKTVHGNQTGRNMYKAMGVCVCVCWLENVKKADHL